MAIIGDIVSLPARYRPWRPEHLRLIWADVVGTARQPKRDDLTHLRAVMNWLCRAQDLREGMVDAGGVSAGWSFEDGWLPSYPETSGYIVETLLAGAEVLREEALIGRANRILDWELSIQTPEGAFPGHFGEEGSRPVIFNTGQIVHGLMGGYGELGRTDCLEAAVRAADWLVASQDSDGCWRRNVHNGIPHTYNTRAAWALLRVGMASGKSEFIDAAARNFDWAVGQQNDTGWYAENAFTRGAPPFTHTIAYAARGLLEGGNLLSEKRYILSAEKASRRLAKALRGDGWLAGTFDGGWTPRARYCCLTGLAQSALIWLRLADVRSDDDWRTPASRALLYLKRNHRITGTGAPDDGGIAGSSPIWGAYSRFEYPNWAAKFFADLLLMTSSNVPVPRCNVEQPVLEASADG